MEGFPPVRRRPYVVGMWNRTAKCARHLVACGLWSSACVLLWPSAAGAQEPCDASSPRASIAGRVRDVASEVPLPGARVVVRWADGTRETRSAGDGGFVFCDLPEDADLALQAFVATLAGEAMPLGRDRLLDVDLAIALTGPSAEGSLEVTRDGGAITGRVTGRVVDAGSEAPVAGAVVAVRGLSALTSESGAFVLDDVPPGPASLTVEHIGYGTLVDTLTLFGHATVDVTVRLATDPVQVEPITVTVEQVRDRRLEVKGFYERRRWGEAAGTGSYFTREDIERRNPHLISQMIADLPGVRLNCGRALGSRFCDVEAVAAVGFSCHRMSVYIDGIRVISGDRPSGVNKLDNFVLPIEVGAVEVYRGAASLPAEFGGAGAQCGVVAIWTRGR